ncbi:hypothetical protein GOP47_0000141 [Adiantum capillus-veneris]|uniref:Uncharacterized protein n=1 Tax=Adiantum capillus-veneris TaxID=13818 RepID=A0A9D4VD14_ADICA|nr:hypothetical protein GOP47_0000141 [Adiantum capillus-veneris]
MPAEELPIQVGRGRAAPAVSLNGRDKAALDFIDSVTRNADAVQGDVLSAVLARNSNTEYLRRLGLSGCTNRQTFKRVAPLVTYEDLQPDIQRIANGDKSPILSSHPVSEFLTSSGTSGGERKLMPTIEDEFERRSLLYSLLMPVMKQYVDGLDEGKGLYFLFVKSETKTPGGLLARPVLTSYYKSEWFRCQAEVAGNQYTSPVEAVLCQDVVQSMYSQLICGLVQREEVVRVGAVFASGFLRAIRFLQERWPELVEDMRQKKLGSGTVRDAKLRELVEGVLSKGGGPAAAAEIESECGKANWQGIIKRLWPRAKYVDVIVTGSMAQYIPTLDFFAGGLPLVSTMYASSECYFGLNLMPLSPPSSVSYTLLPNMAYFEFLPISEEPSLSNLVDLVDVELGKEYELVITTYAGLYRYRVGDVLRVTGFHNKAPQFSFVCRKNVVLTIDSDKTDEDTLQRAIKAATSKHLDATGCRLVEYTSYADLSSIPGHYVIYWELSCNVNAPASPTASVPNDNTNLLLPSSPLPDSSVFEDCCLAMEDCLDSVYRQGRVSDKSIGPLEIRVVEPGTFDALMDYCLARGASINQYKAPRCLKYAPLIDLLNSRVTHSFFSPKCPFWTPERSDWANANANIDCTDIYDQNGIHSTPSTPPPLQDEICV